MQVIRGPAIYAVEVGIQDRAEWRHMMTRCPAIVLFMCIGLMGAIDRMRWSAGPSAHHSSLTANFYFVRCVSAHFSGNQCIGAVAPRSSTIHRTRR